MTQRQMIYVRPIPLLEPPIHEESDSQRSPDPTSVLALPLTFALDGARASPARRPRATVTGTPEAAGRRRLIEDPPSAHSTRPLTMPPSLAIAAAGAEIKVDEAGAGAARDGGVSPAAVAARRFLAVYLEVISGFRQLRQLRPLCRPDRFTAITSHLSGRVGRATPFRGRAHCPTRGMALTRPPAGSPPRNGRASHRGPHDRVVLRRLALSEAIVDVAEVAAVLSNRDVVWAVALRLENRSNRWLCTHFEVV